MRQFYFPDLDLRPPNEPRPVGVAGSQGSQSEEEGAAQEPLTEEEKRMLSVNMFNDELDERQLDLDARSEKFFMYVFKALLYTQNRRILYQLLDVVNFYIKHETPYQRDVINPTTILWMLRIIDRHKEDPDLCLLAAKTVLKVVMNHVIPFGHQEMAIIKKFNKALDNLGGDGSGGGPSEASSLRSASPRRPQSAQAAQKGTSEPGG